MHNKHSYLPLLLITILLAITQGLTEPAWGKGYVIGEGDTLKITVYDQDDLTTTVRVDGEESILLPLLGRVKVGGLTVAEAADRIAALLSAGYIINPQVNIFIVEFRSKKVVILGQVAKPGVYELSGATTFLELLSKAGGLTENAGDSAVIKSKDKNSGENKTKTINIRTLLESGDLAENIQINDGDNVYVEKAGQCYVTGEVVKPGVYKIDEKTTVINAITLAGGFTGKASRKHVAIIRVVGGEKKTLEGMPLASKVEDQDIIIIPESFF